MPSVVTSSKSTVHQQIKSDAQCAQNITTQKFSWHRKVIDSMIRNLSNLINLLLTTCLISGLTGAGLLLLGWPKTESIQTFVHSSPFIIWLIFLCVLFALLPVALLHGALELKRLYAATSLRFSVNILWFFIVALGLCFVPSAVTRQFHEIFPRQQVATLAIRMDIVNVLCILATLPSFLGLSVLAHTIHKLSPKATNFADRYFDARKSLEGFVFAIGSIVGAGTLATGGLQQTLQAHVEAGFTQSSFPPELTFVYGAYYSFVLFVISLPTEMLLHEKGNQFVSQHVSMPPIHSPGWSDSYSLRQQVMGFFGLKSSLSAQVRSSFGKLTPLIGGLIAYLLPITS